MRINNFDQSSCGMNLELSCFRDNDRPQQDFEESFTRVSDRLWVYTEFGNVSDDFSLLDPVNYEFTVKELKNAILNYDKESALSDALANNGKSFYKLNKIELECLLNDLCYDSAELAEFLQDNFTPLFDTMTTRGYCQGDYAQVIITPAFKQFLVDNGTTFEKSKDNLQTTIDHLFWDAPIYCRLSVNDDALELFLDEYLTDCYEWDKDQLILDFTTKDNQFLALPEDQQKLIAEFLADNLPEDPDYN